MSALTDLLDALIGLEARTKAAGDLARPLRAKAEALVLERWKEEGIDRFRRDGATVSLVKATPYIDPYDPDALTDWLPPHLVVVDVEVTDHDTLAAAVHAALHDPDADAAPVMREALLSAVQRRARPLHDWHEHVGYTAAADGRMVTADGEVIPGARLVTPEPRSIRILLDRDLRDAATQLLADEVGGAQ